MVTKIVDLRRSEARQRAAAFIAASGLTPEGDHWLGQLQIDNAGEIPIRLSLPECFPDQLPIVEVERGTLPRRVPHIERCGKICLAPSTGVLLDKENPEGIVRDSLSIARRTLTDGLAGQRDGDFQQEFLAYWNPTDTYISACDANGPTREISLLLMERAGGNGIQIQKIVLSDTLDRGRRLIDLMGGSLKSSRTALFVCLDRAIPTPDFDDALTVREAMRIVRESCSADSWAKVQAWFAQPILPAIVLLSAPGVDGRIVVAIQFDDVAASPRKKAARGFRPGKVPAWRELQFAPEQAVKRIGAERYDSPFLLRRGGAMENHQDRTVAVVGCGAVGSHAADRIASLGVGHLRLVDSEIMEASNLYRHVLGVGHVGAPKADALRNVLSSHFPNVEVQSRAKDVLAVLRDEPEFLMTADVVLFALGDETLELRIDEVMASQRPRIHAWVEPLGIGGHVLVTGLEGSRGCFRCLFHRPDGVGLVNRASFAEAGQSFQKSMAGCSGVFTPFTALDADRTAIEAARLTGRILSGRETRNQLVSWYGDSEEFEQLGFRLSKRARLFHPGECQSAGDLADAECPHCAGCTV